MSNIKDTIYIDVDDDITGIIDKVQVNQKKILALVLPKRATVFQSVVNLKLLKRASEKVGKNIVLITSEASLLPIAGMVGLHVAKTLQSKPEIPAHPNHADINSESEIDLEDNELDLTDSQNVPVGELASVSGVAATTTPKEINPSDIDETIDISNNHLIDDAVGTGSRQDKSSSKKDKKKKDKKNKDLKVPNFNRFRKILITAGIVIVAIILLFLVFGSTFNKANISIQTQTTPAQVNLTLNLDTSAKTLNNRTLTVPAVSQSTSKSSNETVATTGQINNGTKAAGSVIVSAPCQPIFPVLPSGTSLSSGGISFTTQASVKLSSLNPGPGCSLSGKVNIQAVNGGINGNLAANSSFAIPGSLYVSYSVSNNDALSGGTDDMVSAVAQSDIDNANQKFTTQNTGSIKTALQNQLTQAGLVPINDTFSTGTPKTSVSPALGSQAKNVTVTQTVSYTMLGVQKTYLSDLINQSVKKQINTSQQSIIDDGVNSAQFTVIQSSASTAQVTMQANALVGSDLNVSTIKSQIVGLKSADVKSNIKAYPGVTNVTVKFSPFWVNSVPKQQNKITVNISKS